MNKVALVTGSSRGMGKAEIIEFAKRGYDVVINYVGSKDSAEELKQQVETEYKVKAIAIQADLSKEEDVRRLAKNALDNFGKVDVLVNNAGIAPYSSFKEKTIKSFEESMKVNFYAPFLLTQILGSVMMEKKYGKIINIGTIDVMKTFNPESAEYDAAKAALINLTKNSALEFQPYVNVNCICPGWINTDMNKDLPEEIVEFQKSRISKKRFGSPEEVAKVVAFLASDDAEFIDGEIIKVDGGYKLI